MKKQTLLNKLKGLSKWNKIAFGVLTALLMIGLVPPAINNTVETKGNVEVKESIVEHPKKIDEKAEVKNKIKSAMDDKFESIEIIERNKGELTLDIKFQVADNLSKNMIHTGANVLMKNTIKELQNNQWIDKNIDKISFEGYFDLVDTYGNSKNSKILKSTFKVEDINKIQFDKITTDIVFKNFDLSKYVHPALK